MSNINSQVLSFPAKRFRWKNLRYEDEKSQFFSRFLPEVEMTFQS